MKRLITLLFLLACPSVLWAQMYYVDATSGNDNWTGTLPDTQGTDGPWKTVTKVNISSFLPGDSVLFKCGETWREQLVIPSSGMAGSPITFGQYGSNCTGNNNPTFIGTELLSGWQLDSGSIYKTNALLPKQSGSVVTNGSFDHDVYGWKNSYTGGQVAWLADCGLSGGCIKFSSVSNWGDWLYSTPNFVLPPGDYRLTYQLRSDGTRPGMRVRVYDSTGAALLDQPFSADGNWRSYSYDITITTAASAYLYFRDLSTSEVPPPFYIDNVRLLPISTQYDPVRQVFVDGSYVRLAQHPNPIPSPTDPGDLTDTYLAVAGSASCNPIGAGVTSFSAVDLRGAQEGDLIGAGVHIRDIEYVIEDRAVTGYAPATKTITLDSLTRFNVCPNWGFYFDNKRWMLDQAGEWYFDGGTSDLFVWLPDNGLPGGRVEAAHHEFGIDARARANLVIDGISVEKFETGVDLSQSLNVIVRNSSVRNIGGIGIKLDGAQSAVIETSLVENTVRDGIRATKGTGASAISVLNNRINNAGHVGSPKKSEGAIDLLYAGNSLIQANHVTNSGYVGIFAGMNSTVSRNLVEDSCLVLDDCGALYTNGVESTGQPRPVTLAQNTAFMDNIVQRVHGNPHGKPVGLKPGVRGIYLDGDSNTVTVARNTMAGSNQHGISINGTNNVITDNTIYDVGEEVVRISREGSGQVTSGNRIERNVLFSRRTHKDTNGDFILRGQRDYSFMVDNGSTLGIPEATYYLTDLEQVGPNDSFASFDYNRLSGLYSPVVANDRNINTYKFHALSQWRQSGRDVNSTIFDLFSIARYRLTSITGSDLIQNGSFNTDLSGWTQANGTTNWAQCVTGGCLDFATDGSAAYAEVHSNYITLQKGATYLVHFDLLAGGDQQQVQVVAQSGTAAGLSLYIMANSSWESYAYVFTANADTTVRLIFRLYTAGSFKIDNVRLEPVAVEVNDPADDSAIAFNASSTPAPVGCPDTATNPGKCLEYVRFTDGSPVTWPMTVPAMSSEIAVWANNPFRDTDHDGIVDSQDICAATSTDTPTDERGCSFAQQREVNLVIALTDTPDPVFAGQPLNYTVSVNNTGPLDTTGVMMTDTLPSGVTFGSATPSQGSCSGDNTSVSCGLGNLASGGSASIAIRVTPLVAGVITNGAQVVANETDPDTSNNSASVTTTVDPVADLAVTLADTPDPVSLGQTVSYTTTVTNNGPSPASGVSATATAGGTLPACNLGALASGASGSCNATVTASGPTLPTQTMSVSATEFDPVGTNNSDSASTRVVAPNLSEAALTASVSGTNFLINDRVTNTGDGAAGAFDVNYYLSANGTYEASDTLLCSRNIGNLANGASNPATGTTQTSCAIPSAAAGIYFIIARVDVNDAVAESDEGNNVANAAITLSGTDLLPTTLTAARVTGHATRVTISDTVTNQGSQSAGRFAIGYYLSTNTTYEGGDLALVATTNGSTPCQRTRNSLAASASHSVSGKNCHKPADAQNGVDYYVLVVDDGAYAITEYNESNNVRATFGTIRW